MKSKRRERNDLIGWEERHEIDAKDNAALTAGMEEYAKAFGRAPGPTWFGCILRCRTWFNKINLAKADKWRKAKELFWGPGTFEMWCDEQASAKRDREAKEEREQADKNAIVKEIGQPVDEWAAINNWYEDLGAEGRQKLFTDYRKENSLPAIERFVKVWGWGRLTGRKAE